MQQSQPQPFAQPQYAAQPQPYSPPPPQYAAQPYQQPGQPVQPLTPAQRQETGYRGVHPVAAFFHVIFKIGSILAYLIGIFWSSSYVAIFIATTLLLAADFWAVKNVTGRLLVALRWWNKINEDGSSEWIFESGKDASRVNGFDAYFFWVTTYGVVIVWAVLAFFAITSFTKLPMCILGLALSGSNALGYTKCRRDAKSKMTQFMMRQAVQNPGMVAAAMGR